MIQHLGEISDYKQFWFITITPYEKDVEPYVPKKTMAREGCTCLLSNDIGVYNTCSHGCLYCYANYDRQTVEANRKKHDSQSPLLIGQLSKQDTVKDAEQKLWYDGQMSFFDFI